MEFLYAKYNVNYDTNLHRAGFTGTDTVNAPNWPFDAARTSTGDKIPEKVELECGCCDDGNTYAATIEAGGLQ